MENGNKPRKDIKSAYRTSYLISSYIKGNLTPEEQNELSAWLAENQHNKDLFAELTDKMNVEKMMTDYEQSDPEDYLEKSKEQLTFLQKRNKIRMWSYIAAASVAAVILLLFFTNPFSKKELTPGIAINDSSDILPGQEQAVLQLGNGQQIVLLPNQKDSIINQQLSILGKEGELVYNNKAETIEFHTLTIPRKGFYKLKLPDGSVVYLNSESSIHFPTAFTGNERNVTVTGETYFEVAPDKTKPFLVKVNETTITALGTAFNINAYTDEPTITTSLVEGSIKVSLKNGKSKVLLPGQKASITSDKIDVATKDLEFETAWTRNQFKFTNTPLPAIMRNIARWYDADIEYKDQVNVELNATIDRDVPVSKLLYLLAKTEEVHFKIEGKKIIVTK